MRRIVTAITAATLAFSLVAQATPAAAVTGYDSSYAGESAFLNLDQGDTGSFTVFFANTGTTTWATGTSTQVDLAACTEDKTTCNAQDASEAAFNDGWSSATRYATTTQSAVAPGQIGTFTYSVMVPADAAAATYRFNGALVLASTGADVHNEGYYQDVTVAGGVAEGAATLTELDPDSGSVEGGDSVIITGEDFVCDGITVLFGEAEADVISCGETSLTVETPAAPEASGDQEVDVTVVNAGADASNALVFTFEDDVAPTFDSISVTGQIVTLTFSEPVCVDLDDDMALADEFTLRVNGTSVGVTADDISFADCDDDEFETTATVQINTPIVVEGDNVSLTITAAGAAQVEDAAGTTMERATTRSADAEADVTAPTIESAAATGTDEITVTLSENVLCNNAGDAGEFPQWTFTNADGDDFVATATDCAEDVATADDEIVLTFAGAGIGEADEGDLEYDSGADPVEDTSGNDLSDTTVAVTPLEANPPLIDDAALTASGVGLANTADSGDEITLTFSETMAAIVDGDTIRVQDEDGTISDITCTATVSTDDLNATCVLDVDELTITINEDSSNAEGTITDGDVPGLQWPATIIDTSGVTDEEGNDPDLANSADVVIDTE